MERNWECPDCGYKWKIDREEDNCPLCNSTRIIEKESDAERRVDE